MGEINFKDYDFFFEDSLFGVRYWAQHHFTRIPRFDVYVFVGKATKPNSPSLYLFRERRTKALVTFQYSAIFTTLRPFLLNFKAIDRYIEANPSLNF